MSKKKSIILSAIVVIGVILGSKVLGFLRQVIIASSFGANFETDIFFVSSEFMTGLSQALISSLITALVTVYIDVTIKKSRREANSVASKMLVIFLLIGGGLVLLTNLFTPQLATLLAPSYSIEHRLELIRYLRFFSVAFIFTAIQSIFAAVLNANDSFAPNNYYGLLYNPLAILFVLLFGQKWGINALVLAFFVANTLQTFLLYLLSRKHFRFIPSFSLKDGHVRLLIHLSLPLLLSNVFIQLNVIIDKSICSSLGEGAASNYSYANTLEQFVTATITATMSLILLSKYATYVAKGDTPMVVKTFKNSIEGMVLLLAPITAVVMVQATDIVEIVYLRGEFDQTAAAITAKALIGFAPGLALVAIREMYIRLHFSYQDTKNPMIASGVACLINGILSLILARFVGVFGVSLATSLSVILTIWLLNRSVKKYLPEFRLSCMALFFCKAGIAALAGGAAAFGAAYLLKGASVILRFGAGTIACCLVYLPMLYLLRCREWTDFIRELKGQLLAKLKKQGSEKQEEQTE